MSEVVHFVDPFRDVYVDIGGLEWQASEFLPLRRCAVCHELVYSIIPGETEAPDTMTFWEEDKAGKITRVLPMHVMCFETRIVKGAVKDDDSTRKE